ncbi:MAG: prepilin-type N-terminal cleavage/methylation domain-containing protein [Planctomycetota bacterium]|nr:MAG: prepilin-type N-terminal cleavage/methylation domain-containing protein [Planctomycetota bacterium]
MNKRTTRRKALPRFQWRSGQHPIRGFTLIEVLVVVAIIALLISILIPSLSAARRNARMMVCGTNLHTFGYAMTQYAEENKGYIPREYTHLPNRLSMLIPERFSRYLGGPRYPLIPREIDPHNTSQVEDERAKRDAMLAPIFARMEVLQCPSFPKGRDLYALPLENREVVDEQPYDYAVNAFQLDKALALDTKKRNQRSTKLDEIPYPGQLAYLVDANRNLQWTLFNKHDIWSVEAFWWGSNPRMIDDKRHGERANMLFFDSHVEDPRIKSIGISLFTPYLDSDDPSNRPPL